MSSSSTPEKQAPTLPAEALARVARAASDLVGDGMCIGLGTGRTAEAFIRTLAERVRDGLKITGVPTSKRSAEVATSLGIELVSLDDVERLDLDFDGADEVTPTLDLTKGRGGALLRERVVAHVADRFVVLITPDKRVERLGSITPIPIETVPFAAPVVARELARLGAEPIRRVDADGNPYATDNGNAILDAGLEPMDDAAAMDAAIRAIPGVVDTGLFLGMADLVLVGGPLEVETLER
ncbi:MAG: ribose-5-phosphate isomerase RpiA [Deltaproteobacteria bacterium]|jgi:ribose 5-phosphate isomerase A|nr:ribose-5-phosphate isomerase RpiA [Deltaproteobacteria bacterium]MBW2536488.1 ribose-5-phosphate isomerase RpiA [Deltaproteobacteria bacterium]